MNYYIANYEWVFIVGAIPVGAALLLLSVYLLHRVLGRAMRVFRPLQDRLILRTTAEVVLSTFLVFYLLFSFFNSFKGRMKECYVTEVDGEKRLSIRFEREQSANMHDVYTHRFASYDILTGRAFGAVTPVSRYAFNDFSWWGPFGIHAWGYSEESGLMLIDIHQPEIVFDNEAILRKNAAIGPVFKLAPYNQVYDAGNNEITIASAAGEIYAMNPNLDIVGARDRKTHPLPAFKVVGTAEPLPSWTAGASGSAEKWIVEAGAEGEAAGCVLSFKSSSGSVSNRIDICKMFYPETRLFGQLELGGELLIFFTRDRCSLSALRTDSGTGALIGRIHYF